MSIKDSDGKIKSQITEFRSNPVKAGTFERYSIALIIVLVGLSSFGLGRLSMVTEMKKPITIEKSVDNLPSNTASNDKSDLKPITASSNEDQTASVTKSTAGNESLAGKVVASRNGTKYYFPWCGGVSNISEKNKVWFTSEADARSKGYAPASNCKGLK